MLIVWGSKEVLLEVAKVKTQSQGSRVILTSKVIKMKQNIKNHNKKNFKFVKSNLKLERKMLTYSTRTTYLQTKKLKICYNKTRSYSVKAYWTVNVWMKTLK